MGSANSVVGAYAYMVQGTAAANVSGITDAKNNSQTASNSFDNILNKVSDSLIQTRTVDVSKQNSEANNQATQTKTDNTAKTDASNNQVAENTDQKKAAFQDDNAAMGEVAEVTDTQETQDMEADTKLQEAITEDGKELLKMIADTFDISEDEVVEAMQVLGLMAADLLNPADLQNLVNELTDPEQAIDLITDSDIYTSLQDLMEGAESMKSELMNEFDLSEKDLQTAIEANKNTFNEQLQTIAEDAPLTENVKDNLLKDMDAKKTTAPQSEAFTDKAPIEDKPVEVITSTHKSGSDNKGAFQRGAESSNLFNQVMNNITEAAINADSSVVSYTDRAQMENIIRQITEKITISANQEETSMELQLHPASLGNVNILLTSGKDGIVAKFTAQNQIVKEAVEAQMVQLQQKFDEQGIKVTSIEVTIASHGFEQNLEQGNDRQPGEASEGRKIKPLRRINLSELEEDETEEITNDAERIAVQMMAANGNSVDFSA